MATWRYHKDQIGNHKLHPETLMLSYGYDPALSEGAVKAPVFLTSTFIFRNAEEGRDFFDYVADRRKPLPKCPMSSSGEIGTPYFFV
jgi:methionine-gamma-lyase